MKGSHGRTQLVPARRKSQTGTWLDLTINDRDGNPLFSADVSDAPADAGFEDCLGLCLARAFRKEVSLANADIAGARNTGDFAWEIDMSGADLTDAVLSYTEFVGCRFDGALLRRTVLVDGEIKACDFTGAGLFGCDLTGAVFQFCNFTGASLWSSRLESAAFSMCRFIDAHILCDDPSIDFAGCHFQNTWVNGVLVADAGA